MTSVRITAMVGLILGLTGASASYGQAATAPAPPTSAQCQVTYSLACYSPKQIQKAYDLGQLYRRGLNGKGRTIVIVDPFGSPTIGDDLRVFDKAFGLPAPPALRVLQPVGPVPPFNPLNVAMASKAGETTEDVEWAHAIAPGANILLVLTPTAESGTGGGFPQYMAAENYVITHRLGDVISQSFSLPEPSFGATAVVRRLRYAYVNAARNHITALAAANDQGVSGFLPSKTLGFYTHPVVWWPASDPLVTGVGGTHLTLSTSGQRTSPDTVWNDTFNPAVTENTFKVPPPFPWAGGGGVSTIFGRPSYQNGVRRVVGRDRGVPDVSLTGSLSDGILVFQTVQGKPMWIPTGGTSGATPMMAGVVAIADQLAKRRLGLINPALYQLERRHAPGIVDITRGNNSVAFYLQTPKKATPVPGYRARRGYDLASGVGTINAARFVPELVRTADALSLPPRKRR
ncbi:MAG TPA: S53 family peptidase [Solirubrobacteraceae bacterium]|jgi:subtilase family serine protease